jgi:SAM-dependent methyltransferase
VPKDLPRYDRFADEYEAMFGHDVSDPATAAMLELLGAVHGMRVLDLPCGEGRVSRALARRGAHVLGGDLSPVLLDKARALEAQDPLGVSYREVDAGASDALAGEVFDRVVCNYGFSDIDDLDGAMSTFTRVLRPGGVLAFSLLHPCFPGLRDDVSGSWPPGAGYYREGFWRSNAALSDLRREVGSNHRMLSTYANMLVAHGLVVEELAEPVLEPWPVSDADPVPMFLAGRCRKNT